MNQSEGGVEPLGVTPAAPYTVYGIECHTPNHWYVGMTRRFVQRRNTYWRGKGAQFVQRHGFKNIFQFGHFATERGAKAAEGEITAMLQGEGLVCAGGGWTGEKEAHFL